MRKSVWIGTLFLVVAAAGLRGDSGVIGGLISGVVFDAPSGSLRPILGAPGAAYLGPPVARGFEAVSVAPDASRAIALAQGRLYWIDGVLAGASPRELAQDAGPWQLAAWSGDSSRVALWLGDRLLLVSPEGPAVSLRVEGLEGAIRALAVADREAVLAAVEGAGVYLLEEGAAPALLAPMAEPVSIAAGGDRAWVVDRARREVLEIRRYREAPELVQFAGPARGLADPIAVAIAHREAAVWVADAAGRKVVRFDPASGAAALELALDFEPSRLQALGESGFLLNERLHEGDPLEVLAGGAAPAVYFVPAPALGEE
jgi:hypothetical protein